MIELENVSRWIAHLRPMSAAAVLLSVCAAAQVPERTTDPPPAPSAADQQKLLMGVRGYVQNYLANLPNFLCTQVTQQFQTAAQRIHWRRGDTLTSALIYKEGREERTLQLVNDRPPKRTYVLRAPLTTAGEFGALLDKILGAESGAQFKWNGWSVTDGRRLAVFDYSVDQSHSTLKLSISDSEYALIPYYGSIYCDPSTGAVWGMTNGASEIPPELATRSMHRTVHYDAIIIGDKRYLLPVHASVLLDTGSAYIRHEIDFRSYRKFYADSTITYTGNADKNGSEPGKAHISPASPATKN